MGNGKWRWMRLDGILYDMYVNNSFKLIMLIVLNMFLRCEFMKLFIW